MRKMLMRFICISIASLMPITAFAEIIAEVDGQQIQYSKQPQIVDNTVYVPLRETLEAMGMQVEWKGQDRSYTVTGNGVVLNGAVNNNDVSVNGQNITMEQPIRLVNAKTMMSISLLQKITGYNTAWNESDQTVVINKAEELETEAPSDRNLFEGVVLVAPNFTNEMFDSKYANDAKTDTFWQGIKEYYPNGVTGDLGKLHNVKRVVITMPKNVNVETAQQEISIEGSVDNESFVTLSPKQKYTFNGTEPVEIECSSNATRYLRIQIYSNTGAQGAQLAEVEVYDK